MPENKRQLRPLLFNKWWPINKNKALNRSATRSTTQLVTESIKLPVGSAYYYAIQYCPKVAKNAVKVDYESYQSALAAVVALHLEWSQAIRDSREKSAVMAKLYWWKKEIECLSENNPVHSLSHPIMQSLLTFYPSISKQTAILQNWVDAQITLLQLDRIFSVADLIQLADAVGHPFIQLLSIISLNPPLLNKNNNNQISLNETAISCHKIFDQNILAAADSLSIGRGLMLAEWIIEIAYRIRRNHLPMAVDDLQTYQVMPEMLFKHQYNQNVIQLLTQQVTRAQMYLMQGQTYLWQQPKAVRQSLSLLLALSRLAYKTLVEIQRNNYQILHQSIELTPIRKLWIAWRASKV